MHNNLTIQAPHPDDLEAWDEYRAQERAALPTCANHPGKPAAGGIGEHYYCEVCVGPEYARHHLWLRSFGVVRGGVEALRP